jgi:quinol monooxygenase YgiN
MQYGLIACFTTKPGQRDVVVAQLTAAGRELSAFGCRQYIVGAACVDEVTVWVSEVWESKQHHDDSLRHDATLRAISQTMPLLTGEFAHHEVTVA